MDVRSGCVAWEQLAKLCPFLVKVAGGFRRSSCDVVQAVAFLKEI